MPGKDKLLEMITSIWGCEKNDRNMAKVRNPETRELDKAIMEASWQEADHTRKVLILLSFRVLVTLNHASIINLNVI